MERGTVTIGIDYYTDVVREHAIMQAQIREARKLCEDNVKDNFRCLYVKEVARIFGFNVPETPDAGYQE